MLGYPTGDPIVITMGRLIHNRAKPPAVKGRRVPARLHALNHENIFFKDLFPLPGIHRTVFRQRIVRGIVQMYMLNSFIMRLRLEHDGKGMVALHAQQHIGIDGNIFCALIPFFG